MIAADQIHAAHGGTLPPGIDFIEDDGRRIFTLTRPSGELDSFAIYLRYGDSDKVRAAFLPDISSGCHRTGSLGCCVIRFAPDCTPEELTRLICGAALELKELMNA